MNFHQQLESYIKKNHSFFFFFLKLRVKPQEQESATEVSTGGNIETIIGELFALT